MLRYGSVCSGIESASVAWEPLGMSAAWFSEIEPFPCSVLKHHWPDVVNFGDMTVLPSLMRMGMMEVPDILVGGTPCQAFSVAGKRESLDDNRGQLTLTYVDLLNAIDEQRVGDECIAVWENVPGVLNTKDNAFGCFLGELSGSGCELQPSGKKWGNAGCVFGPQRAVAWRVIDAQYFGVAQRRRRVFVVASARNGFDPSKVLFESEGLRRDTPPSRETREKATGFTPSSFGQYCEGVDSLRASGGDLGGGSETLTIEGHRMVSFGEYTTDETASTMKARDYKDATDLVMHANAFCQNSRDEVRMMGGDGEISGALSASPGMKQTTYVSPVTIIHGTQDPCVSDNLAFSLGRNNGGENAVFGIPGNWVGRKPENGGDATEPMNNISPCQTVTDRHAVHYGQHVRRLTPTECERLQGFPDGHTDVPHRGKPAADGPRYKAIGNSKAVPCIQWIGARIIAHVEGYL